MKIKMHKVRNLYALSAINRKGGAFLDRKKERNKNMCRKKTEIPIELPNPGTDEAILKGCTCPIVDNHYGKGFMYREEVCFIYSGACPMHGDGKTFEELLEGG